MTTKQRATEAKGAKKGRIKVGKLKLNKETVKNLSSKEQKAVRDGLQAGTGYNGDCLQTNTAIAINCL